MNAVETFNYMIVSVIGTIGFLVSIILYLKNKDKALSARLLAGVLMCTSIVAIYYALVGTSFFYEISTSMAFTCNLFRFNARHGLFVCSIYFESKV
jgi:hypothetical protein